jgi:hypothetical protein
MVHEVKSVAAGFLQAVDAARTTDNVALPVRSNDAQPSARAYHAGQSVDLHLSRNYVRLQETKDAANKMAIVKNYPPFPRGSEGRKRYLEMVAGLRKQMEALVFPPPDKWWAPPLPGARTDRQPPALDARSSDLAVAQVLETIGQIESKVHGNGSEIPAAWKNLPMSVEQASRLSYELGKKLAGRSLSIASQAVSHRNARDVSL